MNPDRDDEVIGRPDPVIVSAPKALHEPADESRIFANGGIAAGRRPALYAFSMPGKPTTVAQYLAALPEDRRKTLKAVRKVILDNLDGDYAEGIQYGMIGYFVPHSVYPAGYHCDRSQPLPYMSIASQKNHMAVYMFCVYGSEDEQRKFREAWAKTGKKLDMGKSCVRFKKLDDLALDVIGATVRRTPAKKFIAHYEKMLGERGTTPRKTTRKPRRANA